MRDSTGLFTDPATGHPRWWGRAAAVVALTAALFAVTTVIDLEPRLLPLLLLVGTGVLALGLLNQAVFARGQVWYPPPVRPSLTRGRDSVAMAHARHLEHHLGDRRPDGDLRDRLASLADEVLYVRHGESLRSSAGRARLGAETVAVLTGAPRRLSLSTIETCIRAIEEL